MNIFPPEYKPFKTKVIFYRIPKNASSSIYQRLGFSNVIKIHENEISKCVDQKIYKNIFDPSHLRPKELNSFCVCDVKDYFSFLVVRNPWDRIVSMYKFSLLNKNLFKEASNTEEDDFISFCNVIKERRNDKFFIESFKQTEWVDQKNPPNMVLRFESLQKDFSNMIKETNLLGVNSDLPHINKTNHEHYSVYYNSETKKIVADVFEDDIDAFKYSFIKKDPDSLKPKGSTGFLRI